jgi:SAM-dependent methyltransferase
MGQTTSDPIDPWTAYWQFNAQSGNSARPELDVLLEPAWNEFTDLLPNGARILDLATGNGPVALSCAERSRSRHSQLRIDAVDAAVIKPPSQAPDSEGHLPIVNFHGSVRLEQLPFENEQFDGVVSQFGFEYADEEKAVVEATRVLSPGGRVRLIIHARDGDVWRDINARQDRLNVVLAQDGVLNLILKLVRAQQQNDVPLFKSKLPYLSAAANKAQEMANHSPPDDTAMFYSKEFLYVWMHRKKYQIDDLVKSLEDGWNQANGTTTRYSQMLRVAKTADDIGTLCERFKTAGLTVDSVRQYCHPGNCAQIAWQVDASKPELKPRPS